MSKYKKTQQLGMNPSTASGRLVKDLLFNFVKKADITCFQCGGELTRDTFSIEHKTPWLDSESPIDLYFDTDNISYSHLNCNIKSARKRGPTVIEHGTVTGYVDKGCRCDPCKEAKASYSKKKYSPEERRKRYLVTGS